MNSSGEATGQLPFPYKTTQKWKEGGGAAGVKERVSMCPSIFWKPRDEKSRNASVLTDFRDLDKSLQTAYSIKGRTFEKKNTIFSFPNISLATQTKHIELAELFFFSFFLKVFLG